jgi:hypothetical protein
VPKNTNASRAQADFLAAEEELRVALGEGCAAISHGHVLRLRGLRLYALHL